MRPGGSARRLPALLRTRPGLFLSLIHIFAVPHDGSYLLLTGNEVGVLLTDYIASSRIELGTMPKNPIVVKTIVTTSMIDRLAETYGFEVVNILTGFKYIGEQKMCIRDRRGNHKAPKN